MLQHRIDQLTEVNDLLTKAHGILFSNRMTGLADEVLSTMTSVAHELHEADLVQRFNTMYPKE
jgi:hypothetical protein